MIPAEDVADEEDADMDKPIRLIKFVITRWSSAFYMLERVLKLRKWLTILLADEPSLPRLTATDWKVMDELVKLLKPFAKATKELEGEKYPTLPKVWRYLVLLRGTCMNPAVEEFTADVRAVRDRLLEVMNEDRTEAYIQVDNLIRCAALTDPAEKV